MDILLIEDSKGDILLIDAAFTELAISYNLTAIRNGRDAVDFIAGAEAGRISIPSLIVLDLNLPLLSGFDVLKEIKLKERMKNIPVVIFSSSAEEKDKDRALELGAAAYFIKPVEYDEYMKSVSSFLSVF